MASPTSSVRVPGLIQRFSRCFTSKNGVTAATHTSFLTGSAVHIRKLLLSLITQILRAAASCSSLRAPTPPWRAGESRGAPCCWGRCAACIQGRHSKAVLCPNCSAIQTRTAQQIASSLSLTYEISYVAVSHFKHSLNLCKGSCCQAQEKCPLWDHVSHLQNKPCPHTVIFSP